jgi:hypothetical protein
MIYEPGANEPIEKYVLTGDVDLYDAFGVVAADTGIGSRESIVRIIMIETSFMVFFELSFFIVASSFNN